MNAELSDSDNFQNGNNHMEDNSRTIAERFISILRDRIDSESGREIIMKMVDGMDGDGIHGIIADCEDMVRFRDFLTEDEARGTVGDFVNFDGSRGGHWTDPDAMFSLMDELRIRYESEGEYNRWAFFAVMNMIWSDEWGVLRNYASGDQEARVCAELAVARLEDSDRAFSVRKYFNV